MSTLASVFLVLLQAIAPGEAPVAPQDSRLDARIERLDLREVTLLDALRILSEESGVNLIASADAAQKTVSCLLQDVTVRQALELVTKSHGLWYREDATGNSVRVLTAQEFERDLAEFRDEQTVVFTLLYPNSVDVGYTIRNLYGDRVQLTLDRAHRNDDYQDLSQRFQRFDLLDRRAQGLGTSGGSSNFFFGQGGGSIGEGLTGGYGINGSSDSDGSYRSRGEEARLDIDRMDDDLERRPLSSDQIAAIQAAIAAGQEPDGSLMNRLRGSQPSIYVTVIRRNNMVAVRSADRGAITEITKLVKSVDVPAPQVLLEVKLLRLDLSDEFDTGVDARYSDGTTTASILDGAFTQGAAQGGLVFQYVNDKFQARLQLMQERNRVSSLATPVLLVANNEVARLFIGEERPIVRSISSQTFQNTGTTVSSPNTVTELRPVGTTLLLTPNINADRTVTLRVLQENSDINPNGASIPVVTSDGTVVSQPIDTVRSRSVTGTIVAKDGFVLAVGGLIDESICDTQTGIPGLMDLPLIGALFRHETKSRSHSELVMLLKPHVLFTASEGGEMSRDLANRIVIHSAGETLGEPMGAYGKDEVPRPPLTKKPLKEMLKYQSGLPNGG